MRPGWCRRRARCGCRRRWRTASPCAAGSRCARSTSSRRPPATLPRAPTLVEVSGLLRELILAALEEPAAYDEAGRGGLVARLILIELARIKDRPLELPMPRDPRALRVARAAARPAGAAARSRSMGRARRREPPHAGAAVSPPDRAELRRMARAAARRRGAGPACRRAHRSPACATAVGYNSPSAFSAMVRRSLGEAPRRLARSARRIARPPDGQQQGYRS